FGSVASRSAAGRGGDAQIARIHKAYVVRIFLEPTGIRPDWICAISALQHFGLGMGTLLSALILGGLRRSAGRYADGRIPAVAIGTSDANRGRRMHRRAVGGRV